MINGELKFLSPGSVITATTTPAPAKEINPAQNGPTSELHALIGLADVKIEVETLGNLAKIFALRKERGLPRPDMSFHLIFTGNPGTGKTTVARIIARIYGQLGLLTKGHLIEVDRSGLVASYVGQTAAKTSEVIERAKGGVLFIDEAYSLVGGSDNDYGREAIETLLKSMEDNRDDLIVIAAGYTDEMEKFISSNPGLRSRFSKTINFPDYSATDMLQIFGKLAADAGYTLTDEAAAKLGLVMDMRWNNRDNSFANARDVRTMFERAISNQASRVCVRSDISDADLTTLMPEDMPTR